MSKAKKLETVYVELDAILDTRLGTINRVNNKLVESILASGTYHTREEDDFDGISKDEFREHYSKRDKLTLANSVVTNAILMLKHLVGALTEQAITQPYHEGCRVVVNYYPYILTDVEQEEFGRVISTWINDLVPVELTRIAPKDLTPEYCKGNYATMIAYEYEDWMNIHAEAFKTTRLPEVTMFVPAIYFNKKPTLEELEEITKTAAHPMKALEMLASPIIGLKLINIDIFSIISKK